MAQFQIERLMKRSDPSLSTRGPHAINMICFSLLYLQEAEYRTWSFDTLSNITIF